MLAYSAPLLPNSIMWYLVDGVNRPIMEKFLGLSAIGLYAVAQRFSGVLYSLLSILTLAWGNSVLDEYGKEGFDKFYNNYLRLLATILFSGAIVLCLLSKFLVMTFTTPEYYDAYKYLPVLLLGVVLSGLSGTAGCVFSAVKKSKYFFYSSVFGGLSSLVSLVILTPLFGLMGTVSSVAISFFCMFIARVYYAKRYVNISSFSYYMILTALYVVIVLLESYCESNIRFLFSALSLAIIIYCTREELSQTALLIRNRFK